MSHWTRVVVLALLLFGCASRTGGGIGDLPGPEPASVVEQFLLAANANDWQMMGNLFGNEAGPIIGRDPRREVEQRMFIMASILRHDARELQSEGMVAGRVGEARRVVMGMQFGQRRIAVPFVLVRSRRGTWLIEQIDLEAITRG